MAAPLAHAHGTPVGNHWSSKSVFLNRRKMSPRISTDEYHFMTLVFRPESNTQRVLVIIFKNTNFEFNTCINLFLHIFHFYTVKKLVLAWVA